MVKASKVDVYWNWLTKQQLFELRIIQAGFLSNLKCQVFLPKPNRKQEGEREVFLLRNFLVNGKK